MIKTIRGRIIVTYVIVFTVVLGLLNGMVFYASKKMIINERKNILKERRKFFIEHIDERIKGGKTLLESIVSGVEEFDILSDIYSVSLKTDTGVEIVNRPRNLGIDFHDNNQIEIADGDDGEEYLVLNDNFIDGGVRYQLQYILKGDYDSYLTSLIAVLAFVEVIGLLASILVGVKISNNVVDPILRICELSERIDSSNLKERVPEISKYKETERLTKFINSMLERLEKSFNTQKNFISNVSHELRTPVSVIKGYTDLNKSMGGNMPKEIVDESFAVIEEENRYMKDIIENLLFLAKEEVNSIALNREVVSVAQMLKSLKKSYEVVDSNTRISLSVDDDVLLNCDLNLVRQMMRGLIDNAIKYGGNDGIILRGSQNYEFIEISVEDFGNGMTDDELEKIFDRFYRSDEARTRGSNGAGLGLSIVEKIARLHQCKIDVDSKVGKGSKFILNFPRREM